jgi:hypothetical protein
MLAGEATPAQLKAGIAHALIKRAAVEAAL